MNNSFSRSAYQEGSTTSVSIQVSWWTRIVIIDMQKFYDLLHYLFFLFSWLPNIITVSYFIWTFKKDEEKFKLDTFWYFEVIIHTL